MKSPRVFDAATTFLVAVILTVSAAAQQAQHHPYYMFVELRTLGGPGSSFTGQAYVLSNTGIAVGTADTPIHEDEGYPFIQHAFRWENGVLKDMNSFSGTNNTFVNAVNDQGVASGNSENGLMDPITGLEASTAALWSPDSRVPLALGTLPGGHESFAIIVNNSGLVAGVSDNGITDPYSLFGYPTQTRAFVWTKDQGMKDIGTLGGPDAAPQSSGLNELGQVAGLSYTNGAPNGRNDSCGRNVPTEDPFFWENDQMTDLGTLGGTCGFANALNNSGQVVGQSDLNGDVYYHPFYWEKGFKTLLDLGTLGGNLGAATWNSDTGNVVGWASFPGNGRNHSFIWHKGMKRIRDLGVLKGDPCNAAWGINSKNQVIGDSSGTCVNNLHLRPFLWENGTMFDLSRVFPTGHYQSSEVVLINNLGEIAGNGTLQNGKVRPFLLIPCKPGPKDCKRVPFGADAIPQIASKVRDVSIRELPGHRSLQGFASRTIGPRN